MPTPTPAAEANTQSAATELESLVRTELENAVDTERRGSKVYESLHNLNEVIGTQYGDRVLYELIQNAHDAHSAGEAGKISIRLVIRSGTEGMLYIANGGTGFRRRDVDAVRNLAISAKEIGEGIGNKGLGFRSVEALTDNVQIFSQAKARKSARFDGYCFRFASTLEIEQLLASYEVEPNIAAKVARTIPRYLVPLPIDQQPDEILAFAHGGYATVIAARLQSARAVTLATEQVQALADLEVPLLLFLDRIGEVRIEIELPEKAPNRKVLRRTQIAMGDIPNASGCSMCEVDIGEGRRFLVVRRVVDRDRVIKAVTQSIPAAPQLKRWLNWKGDPVVSVAVGLNIDGISKGRLYNFLPMGDISLSPLLGYLDAPFFADIDRRNADLALPLNEMLIEAAAEACVVSALSIIERKLTVPAHAVFDLIAWTGREAAKLDRALVEAGSTIRDAKIIPAIRVEGADAWSSLSEISVWPEGQFSVLKASDVARYVGAELVSSVLDGGRLTRLEKIAARVYLTLKPSQHQFAEWAEGFSRSLLERKVAYRTWSRFYDDVVNLFGAAGVELGVLKDKAIFLDHTGKLRSAVGEDTGPHSQIFIRGESRKGKRSWGGIPMPPGTLTRRFSFLEEKLKLSEQTLDSLVRAGLLRLYDPVVALQGLKSTLGKNANDSRRQEALVWAFQVWRAAGAKVDDILRDAELHVLTLSGWSPSSTATFSSSWTPLGRTLENYLFEVAELSPDCKRVRELLLVPDKDWPSLALDSRRQWVRFLEIIGVADGIRPIAGRLARGGQAFDRWIGLIRNGKKMEGFDEDWCAEVARVSFYHPYTNYQMKGEAWRFPGQIEYDQIPESARDALSTLIFEHLKAHRDAFFRFELGRFDRYHRDWDSKKLPTPLAAFLRSKPWIAANTREGIIAFRRPHDCWGARARRGGPPRFVDRVPDTAIDLTDHSELADFIFSGDVGVQDWQIPSTAVGRLSYLATIATDLASNERPTFHREYQRAWHEVAETQTELQSEFTVVIHRRGQIETLTGDRDSPPVLIVSQDAQRFEARVLSAAGRPVLAVGEASTERVTRLLESQQEFSPLRIDGIGVQLLVDNVRFVPSASDPFLTSFSLAWLPEVLVIGHEIGSEQLERGVLASTVDRKARAIRVRECEELSLIVDGQGVTPTEHLSHYAFEHENIPTLILTTRFVLDWSSLAQSLSASIVRLIDPRLRTLERLMLKLALVYRTQELTAPSDEALARALDCDVQTVQEHRLSLRTDLSRVLHLLTPVVAFLSGPEMAGLLLADADQSGIKFSARNWLIAHPHGPSPTPDEVLHACEKAGDRAEVRRLLNLDYAAFNRALISLGEPPISNEPALRQLYDAYLARMAPDIWERLRRHHVDDFRNGRGLDLYVERKNLVFLPFDSEWILTKETLEQDIVENHVNTILEAVLGEEDTSPALPALTRLLETNRKTVRSFVNDAMPIVRAWCGKNDGALPAAWQNGELHAVLRQIENNGLLDFESLSSAQLPSVCNRSGCWPKGMAQTLSLADLALGEDELGEEEKRAERERRRSEIVRRSITFGGASLDTADAGFSDRLRQIADASLSGDQTWFERSRRRVKLATFEELGQAVGGGRAGGKGKGRFTGDRQMTDAQRAAMGLASEWLAYHFLRLRYPDYAK